MDPFTKEFEHLRIQLQDIESTTNNFDRTKVIGSGGFGNVYKGEVSLFKGRSFVAIKRLDRKHGQGDPEFWKEIMMLSRYSHENLISLLGFCDEHGEKILVYEYAFNGSLDRHLSSTDLTWSQRIKICLDAARGLCYLHDDNGLHQRILHRDIKSANILLDDKWNAKVADMGLSKVGPANQPHTALFTGVVGTIGYLDPIYLKLGVLTKESDVYSFGIVLFEVLCGKLCLQTVDGELSTLVDTWKKSYKKGRINEIIFKNVAQPIDPNALRTFSEVAFQCLHKNREGRPLMSHVVEKLETALEIQEPLETALEIQERHDIKLPEEYNEMIEALEELEKPLSKGVFLNGGQTGSSSMAHSDSSKRSSSSDSEDAELVYLKDNVTIHPTQDARERISGLLKLIKQGSSLFMTWIPYKGQSSNARLSERDKNLYTIRAVAFSDIQSIRRHTPTIGWQYVIVVLSSGLAFPPLYFYSGGVREFLATIKRHVLIVRSSEDANVFLVNNFQDPLQRTLSSLELPRSLANGTPSSSFKGAPSDGSLEQLDKGTLEDDHSSSVQQNNRQRKKNNDPARDISIQVLEKFSLVTRFARETTSQLFRESLVDGNGHGPTEKRRTNWASKDYQQQEMASNDMDTVPKLVPVPSDPLEFDKLTLVWGQPRQHPLGLQEWSTFLDSEGRVVDQNALKKRIFYGGVEHNLRKEVWAFLLGYYSYDSTYAERQYVVTVKKSEYETIKNQWQSISPEQAKRFTKFRERKGLIEKDVVRTDRSLSFYEGDDNPNVRLMHDILLTYSFYNFDLGYCQGMSDLLSPILFIMKDESEAFWCFVSLLERLGPNFNRDQNGMHAQLFALSKLVEQLDGPLHNYFKQNDCLNYFFCFRWILIQFKREFEYEKTLRLWEVLWTHYPSEHLHLYVCIAILKRHRAKIMGEQMDFDTLLKFINELSGQIDLDPVLRDAEALCVCAGENGAASIPPGTPPSLPIEDGSIYQQQDDEVL